MYDNKKCTFDDALHGEDDKSPEYNGALHNDSEMHP